MQNNSSDAFFQQNIGDKSAFTRYKSVIAELMKISYRTEHNYINVAKLHKYAFNISNKLLSGKQSESRPQFCALSRINDAGYSFPGCEMLNECSVIAIEDEYGAVADELLSVIKNEAISRKADVICCYNPFMQYTLERIILPQSHAAICRESSLCKPNNITRRVHASRFYSNDLMNNHSQTLKFNKKIIKELLPNCHRLMH